MNLAGVGWLVATGVAVFGCIILGIYWEVRLRAAERRGEYTAWHYDDGPSEEVLIRSAVFNTMEGRGGPTPDQVIDKLMGR